jgi:hypothetical protein
MYVLFPISLSAGGRSQTLIRRVMSQIFEYCANEITWVKAARHQGQEGRLRDSL